MASSSRRRIPRVRGVKNSFKAMPKVSVVILNWNGKKFLDVSLSSLHKVTYASLEVIVVDNHSSDGSVSYIRRKFPWVRLIALSHNAGFAGGNNIGFKKSTGKYVLFLNNDTKVTPKFLEPLVAQMEKDPTIGCIQPQMRMMANDALQDEAGGYLTHCGFLYHYGYKKKHALKPYRNRREVFSIKGACMILPRLVFERIGMFDEDFFIFFEETDVCHRIWLSGFRVIYDPVTYISHVVGGDTTNKYSYQRRIYLTFKNMTCSYLKNFGFLNMFTIYPLFLLIQAGLVGSFVVKLRGDLLWAVVRAYGWNIRNIGSTLKKRKDIQATRKISDRELNKRVLYDPDWNYYSHSLQDTADTYIDMPIRTAAL